MSSGGAALVTMMESADLWNRMTCPSSADWTERGSGVSFCNPRRPASVIVVHEALKVPVEASFIEHDHVVQAFATNRADNPFDIGSLPRGTWRS